jgi:hypothetical protein
MMDMATAVRDAMTAMTRRGGSLKLAKFSSTDGDQWHSWKHTFCHAVVINGWTNTRARQQLSAHMEGAALAAVEGIPVGDVAAAGANDADDYNLLLTAYDQRFRPQGAVDHLRQEEAEAIQREDESVAQWAGRYRNLYLRSHPQVQAMPLADVETWPDLRYGFMDGLRSSEVRKLTKNRSPDTYSDAILYAQNAAASTRDTSRANKGKGEPFQASMAEVHAVPGAADASFKGKCHWCQITGHMKRDCNGYKAHLVKQAAAGGNRGRGRGRGRGSWNRSRGSGRTNASPHRTWINPDLDATAKIESMEKRLTEISKSLRGNQGN